MTLPVFEIRSEVSSAKPLSRSRLRSSKLSWRGKRARPSWPGCDRCYSRESCWRQRANVRQEFHLNFAAIVFEEFLISR